MPAPMAPWISASEALTIWMLSTAMKAPSVAPITAIQVLAGVLTGIAAAFACGRSVEEAALRVGCSVVIGGSSCSDEWRMR